MFPEKIHECKTCKTQVIQFSSHKIECPLCTDEKFRIRYKCGQCHVVQASQNKALLCCSGFRLVRGKIVKDKALESA
jgi:ribosomal protein S27AE